jgi:hypothetical protein
MDEAGISTMLHYLIEWGHREIHLSAQLVGYNTIVGKRERSMLCFFFSTKNRGEHFKLYMSEIQTTYVAVFF